MKRFLVTAVATSILALSGGALATENPPLKLNEKPVSITATGQLQLEASLAIAKGEASEATELRRTTADLVYKTQLANNQKDIELRILEALDRVGKTPYVFSGSSVYGWDCSGFTLWFYESLNVELPHSASGQSEMGIEVTSPQIGDLVIIGSSATNIHHTGIYIGDGLWVHSGWKPGRATEVLPLDHASLQNYYVGFKRFIDISE
jgi:murein DD-endopeptidase / murein LD-carboxypeptidase